MTDMLGATGEPTEADEAADARLQQLVRDSVLRRGGYADQDCASCTYYLREGEGFSYCWHPKVGILVDSAWWCQWWEER